MRYIGRQYGNDGEFQRHGLGKDCVMRRGLANDRSVLGKSSTKKNICEEKN